MHRNNRYEGIDEFAVRSIRSKARELVGQYGYTRSDIKDLEQELVLDLLKRLPKYDPKRAQRNTFINRIINHKVATIIESKKAAKRDYRRSGGSLSEDYEDSEGRITPRLERVDSRSCRQRMGWSVEPSIEQMDLKIDLDQVVAGLPPELRELCERLKFQTVAEIFQETGAPRSTIYDRMKRIRAVFEDRGLKEYL